MKKNGLQKIFLKAGLCVLVSVGFIYNNINAQTTKLTLDLTRHGAKVSPLDPYSVSILQLQTGK